MQRTRAIQRGFLLGELIIVLAVSSVVLTALLAGVLALVRALQPQNVSVAGESVPIAPTFGAFPAAVRLHQTLSDHVAAANAIYVFGGKHVSIPAEVDVARLAPLRIEGLPDLANFSAGLPLDAYSFFERYQNQLGECDVRRPADDFTVLVIGTVNEHLAAVCVVQVYSTALKTTDGAMHVPFTLREVRLWDREGAQRYAFAEPLAAAAGTFVGAVHTWLRYSASTGAAEEGPTCAVFPDPWRYGGNRGRDDDIPPFSRFSYLLPVSP